MEALLNREQTAAILGIDPRTLDNWATLKRGPAYSKVGSKRMYDPADLRTWIEERKVRH